MLTSTAKRYTEGMVSFMKNKNTVHYSDYWSWKLYVNQGWREAYLLGTSGYRYLFAYIMPSGNDYLAEIELDKYGYFKNSHKSINRKRPPARWEYIVSEWMKG